MVIGAIFFGTLINGLILPHFPTQPVCLNVHILAVIYSVWSFAYIILVSSIPCFYCCCERKDRLTTAISILAYS